MVEMSDRDAIRIALYDAIEWQRGLVHAYEGDPDCEERKDALSMIRKYKAVLRKRYGTDRNAAHDFLAKQESVDVLDLLKGMRTKRGA